MATETPKRIIGVDIGSTSLKAVLLERQGEKTVCLGLQVIRYGEGATATPPLVLAALTELANLWKARTTDAALVTSDREYQVKFVEKPAMSRENLDMVMHNEFKAGLSNPEDAAHLGFVYAVVGETRGEMSNLFQIMTVTFPLSHLQETANLFQQAGLRLIGAFPFAIAAREVLLANHYQEFAEEEPPYLVAMINFGATSNQVTVCDKQVLRLARTFPFAGEELSQTLIKDYKVEGQDVALDHNMAEAYKATVGLLTPEEAASYGPEALEVQVSELIRRGLDRMTQKLRLSLDYFKGQMKAQVARAYIFGGGANLRGLREHLSGWIMVPEVKELEPFLRIPYKPEGPVELDPPAECTALVALAMGAGLSGLQSGPDILNLTAPLLAEAARRQREFLEQVVLPGILLAIMAIVPVLYWFLVYRPALATLSSLQVEHQRLAAEFAKVATIKDENDKLTKQQQDVRIRTAFIRNITQRKIYWSKLLMLLHSLLPPEIWLMELSSRTFLDAAVGSPPRGGDIILIKGYSQTFPALSAFLKKLEGTPTISNLVLRESKRESNGQILFTITCGVVQGAN
ncbi:MAG: Type IV pilus biogenesis protein PilM [Candidatus Ozemobacter sibiricus]|uniref:Type IV pilus biogenesis protein PilM n=1 Tax=Candidatus Ozemobacter sibiricus TaxID=2268124 RepID=A0A367ZPP9_9BACT|nr:MAG: Type IV pilus biogenesis protein PilM [Candidatus Ozemobacter sibiricus]